MKDETKLKVNEFFGAQTVSHPLFGEQSSWQKRNEAANTLTKVTSGVGIAGGLPAFIAGVATESLGLTIGGGIGLGTGLVMMTYSLIGDHIKNDKSFAPLSMKALTSVGIGAKNLVVAPFKFIKNKIEEHNNDYNNTFHGPYAD